MIQLDRIKFFGVCRFVAIAIAFVFLQANVSPATAQGKPAAAKKKGKDAEEKPPLTAAEIFVPQFQDNDLAGAEDRAWEYRPYRVAVWCCLDGSPRVNAIYPMVAEEVIRRSELLDASGWDLTVGPAPSKFRNQFLKHLRSPERCEGFTDTRVLGAYDKIMIVCLTDDTNHLLARVREFDVQTQQWGPVANRQIGFSQTAGQQLMDAIVQSFMPLAQIDRVTAIPLEVEEGKPPKTRDEVLMNLRAVKSCLRAVLAPAQAKDAGEGEAEGSKESLQSTDDAFQLKVEPTKSSPAFVRSSDWFLPVIRTTDKYNNLKFLEPLEFTFLSVDRVEEAEIRASIRSSARAPLNQRKSRRAKKLALVIRPPQDSTTLRLISTGKEKMPMEGFSIYEKRIDAPKGEKAKLLGQTDWKGEFEVQPVGEGLRMLLIKRGERGLRQLPIVPGLYASVESALPNDETRLYSEGVFKAFDNEILGLMIQREVARVRLAAALKKDSYELAKVEYDAYRELEEISEIRQRLSIAVSDLKARTSDTRESQYIQNRYDNLEKLLDNEITKEQNIHFNKETKKFGKSYLEQLQDLKAKRPQTN
jgi:hypothetical protein